ncbi:EF-hand domain-containing protein [Brevundimonas sp. PAMC22021]|uniref:EF-hand domain-containing protein n=1 Tax=Brevundimonas sp. PAMC22021 TaxID=2861285 RepID=UPI001C62536D|nr:EF-hand domain-containing protein [Brevundimonas sp. PAMC22021]QYF86166.1 EF-hand domain-containing protein [Brevundimonas sp. PAMC22021]
MQIKLIIAGLALAGAAAGTTAMAAQNAVGTGPQAQRVARADADRDGRISRTEFVDARVSRLGALDANRDGSVAVEERRAGRQAQRAERASNRFAKLDANSDGMLSRAEFEARPAAGRRAHAARPARAGHAARGPVAVSEARTRLEQRFDRLDANGDGYLTSEERRAGKAHRRMARPAVSPPAPASE